MDDRELDGRLTEINTAIATLGTLVMFLTEKLGFDLNEWVEQGEDDTDEEDDEPEPRKRRIEQKD